VIALIVKLDSSGPFFFRQRRVGKDGRPFTLLKFRSMVVDADRLAPNVSATGDPRVTRVGRFLRRWYLDELPQLLNVLRGDMSMVGPRPETPEYVALLSERERAILRVRPGLAGPSTLGYMNEAEILAAAVDARALYVDFVLHDRVRLDLRYLQERSFWYDVRLLVRQVFTIFRFRVSASSRRASVLRLVVVLAAVAGIVRLSLGPDLMTGVGGKGPEASLPHVAAYTVLALVLLFVAVPRGAPHTPLRVIVVSLSVVALGAVLELGQAAVHRDTQMADVAANALGVAAAALAWVLVRLVRRLWSAWSVRTGSARSAHASEQHPEWARNG
jgi:lipopolysaccharide/colanic/teichoic acid biosynthesis glycosyltransferase